MNSPQTIANLRDIATASQEAVDALDAARSILAKLNGRTDRLDRSTDNEDAVFRALQRPLVDSNALANIAAELRGVIAQAEGLSER